jgi:hypothetical protein
VAFVQDDHCGCSFGVCIRLDPINGNNDWYEPNEVKLEKAGLPWFYFIPGPENLVDEERDKYVQESERLWGISIGSRSLKLMVFADNREASNGGQ